MNNTRSDLLFKAAHLQEIVAGLGSVGVALSGGVDSTLLLAVCRKTLGRNHVVALTAYSKLTPAIEKGQAEKMAQQLDVRQVIVHFDALKEANIAANLHDRCYHCKRVLFTRLLGIAREEGMAVLVHGANLDDRGDHRPGMRAADEMGVRAPLMEACLTKRDVRTLSRQYDLPTWNLPSMACLASRIPYGTPLTPAALTRVDRAESILVQRFGLRQVRVRDHFPLARIEVPQADLPRLSQAEMREEIVQSFKGIGYQYVTLDLEGFRSGSMNEVLELDVIDRSGP